MELFIEILGCNESIFKYNTHLDRFNLSFIQMSISDVERDLNLLYPLHGLDRGVHHPHRHSRRGKDGFLYFLYSKLSNSAPSLSELSSSDDPQLAEVPEGYEFIWRPFHDKETIVYQKFELGIHVINLIRILTCREIHVNTSIFHQYGMFNFFNTDKNASRYIKSIYKASSRHTDYFSKVIDVWLIQNNTMASTLSTLITSLYDTRDPLVKLILNVTVLESLFNSNRVQIGHTLSRHASVLVSSKSEFTFDQRFSFFKKVYNARSGIVHGSKVDVDFAIHNRKKLHLLLRRLSERLIQLHIEEKVILVPSYANYRDKLFNFCNRLGFQFK